MKRLSLALALLIISAKSFSQTKIDANTVPQHIGDSVIVEGKITDTSYSQTYGAKIFQIAQRNGGTFDVLVKNENRNNFQSLNLVDVFNKNARIIGKIIALGGRNRIYVTTSSQFVIILGE